MKVFDKLVGFLSERLESSGSAVLLGSHERMALRKDAFFPLVAREGTLAFVDSGSGEVLSGANLAVNFIRLYGAIHPANGQKLTAGSQEPMANSQSSSFILRPSSSDQGTLNNEKRMARIMREFVLAVVGVKKDLDLAFEAVLFTVDGVVVERWLFDAFASELCWGGHRAEPSAVVGNVRKVLEFRLAAELCEHLPAGSVLVRDGDLEASGQLQESARSALVSAGQSHGVVVLGVSKTSTLCTDSGNSALVAVQRLAPSGRWGFYAGGSVGFVKLHPSSRYVFRCDVLQHDRERLDAAFGSLAANSRDPAFLGYPFGLVDADKFAQVTKEESASLRVRFAVLSKNAFVAAQHAVDAHDVLNLL
ncbi:hypothetical protein HY489_00665 [Candidatus Woesearchaeota archaeon]|nr:hypothetical protein [Candidatus Woesearchaeota archaeon]